MYYSNNYQVVSTLLNQLRLADLIKPIKIYYKYS
jgi:hypothetical protein